MTLFKQTCFKDQQTAIWNAEACDGKIQSKAMVRAQMAMKFVTFYVWRNFYIKTKKFQVCCLSILSDSCPIFFIPTSLKVVWHSQLILSFNLVCFHRVTMWEFTRKKRNFKGTTAKIFRVSLRLEQLLSNLTRPIWQNISLVKCKNSIEGLISQNERRLEKKQNCCNCTFGKFFQDETSF